MEIIFQPYKRYAVFSGRARRLEFWLFVLFGVGMVAILSAIDIRIGTHSGEEDIGLLSGIFCLATVIPSISVAVRRLHDLDKSGWWVLLSVVPIIGPLWLFILYCMAGTSGNNRFGPNPKG